MKFNFLSLISLLLVACMFLLVGCTKEGNTDEPSNTETTEDVQTTDTDGQESGEDTDAVGSEGNDESSDTSDSEDTSEADTTDAEPEDKDELSEEGSIALISFRQSMIGTPQMFGVAFLGYQENIDKSKLSEQISAKFPGLYENLPFVGEINEDHIIGGEMGDIFCVVPLDSESYVTVSRCMYTGNDESHYDDKIYSSEEGSPIIIICNGGGFEPDTELIIENKSGNAVTWYPQIADTGRVRTDSGNCSAAVIKDFTAYSELLWREYSERKDGIWKLPAKEDLVGTTWYGEDYMEDGNVYWYNISFKDGYADVRWNNDGEEHEYSDAAWELTYDEGVALIEFDFGQFEGLEKCAVLITTEGNLLYTCADVVSGNEFISESSRTSRTLERQYG